MTLRRYLFNLLRLLSVALNVVFLFDGTIQTLSRRIGRARNAGRRWGVIAAAIVNPIFRLIAGQKDHVGEAASGEGCIH